MTQAAQHATLSSPLFDKQRRPYMWRKLFSLTGLVPVAGYTMFHLWENAKALQGRDSYAEMVHEIHKMPFLTLLEIGVIMVPILLHAVIGTRILLDAKINVGAYTYSGNWMYTLQRATAIITGLFIVYHVWELRVQKLLYGMDGAGFYDTLCRNMSATWGGVPLIALLYVIGIASVSFHLANGLWGFCFSWGITVSRRSQRIAASVFGLLGVAIFILGANTAVYFATGSRMYIPSEWFNRHKPAVEHCPASAVDAPANPQPSSKPAPSVAP